jgi:hypothetical protein
MTGRLLWTVAACCLTLGAAVGSATAAQTVTGASVKNNALTGKELKGGSLGPQDFAPGTRGPSGPAGPAGAASTQPGYHWAVDPAHISTSVPPTTLATLTVSCPAGQTALGAGVDETTNWLVESHAVDSQPAQWKVGFNNTSGATIHPFVFLYCTT